MLTSPVLDPTVFLGAWSIGLVSLVFLGLFVAQSFRLVHRLNHARWPLIHPWSAFLFAFLGGLAMVAVLLALPALLVPFISPFNWLQPLPDLLWPGGWWLLAGWSLLALATAVYLRPARRLLVYYLLFGLLLAVAYKLGALTIFPSIPE